MKDSLAEVSESRVASEDRASAHAFPAFRARSWFLLVLFCTGQFLVVLDFSIVNVALPSIQHNLHFSAQNLQWIVSAYSLTLGGLLLLGGRAGDLFGRRRLFVLGLALFVMASLLGGFAPSQFVLLLARALQGLGAALVSPNAFALLTTTFEEGAARNKALGVFGAVVSSALVIGNVLGGALTAGPGWRWVFFVNVPVAAAAILCTLFLPQDDLTRDEHQHIDVLGALVATVGLLAFVYVVTQGNAMGWGSLPTLGLLVFALLCLGTFVLIEAHISMPLVRLGIFRSRTLTIANIVSLFAPGAFAAMIFILTLYMQEVLGYTAFTTGLAFLPLALMMALTSSLAARIFPRLGPKRMLLGGMGLMTIGLLLLLNITPENNYASTVLPGILIVCLGIGPLFTTTSIIATTGIQAQEQGLAAGLLNTTQQIGQGLVLAVVTTVSTAQTAALQAQGMRAQAAQVFGFHTAFVTEASVTTFAFLIVLMGLSQWKARFSSSTDPSERSSARP